MIDIVIPHFNGANLVGKLLNSIKFESWVHVYIVDDHSDKEQFELLQKLCQNYPSVNVLQVPKDQKGPGIARNLGIESSNGRWLLFADVDDFFVDGAFNILLEYLESKDDIVFFPPEAIMDDLKTPSKRNFHYNLLFKQYQNTLDDKVFYKFYAPWSKLISRENIISNQIEFDDGIGGEDNCFSLKIAFYANSIRVCQKPIYCVVDSIDSLTKKPNPVVIENHFMAMSRFNDFLQKNNEYSYQAPMLGWIVKGGKISIFTSFKWLWISLKKSYPVNPFYYIKSGLDS